MSYLKDKEYYRQLLSLTIPIALTNLISSMLNFIDTIMLGNVGTVAVSSVGIANQIFFLLYLFVFGICNGSSIIIAQMWGARKMDTIYKTLGLSLMLCAGVSIAFTVLAVAYPELAMRIYTNDPEVIAAGADYLKIVGLTYLLNAVCFAYYTALRTVERPVMPLVISGISLGINSVLNYLLIFGVGPFPNLGVEGAAIATAIARIFEFVVLSVILLKGDNIFSVGIKSLFGWTGGYIKKYFKIVFPVILNEGLWGVGTSVFTMIYGRMDTSIVAATNMASSVEKVLTVFGMGISSATSIMIGKKLGEEKPELAYTYSIRSAKISVGSGIVFGLAFIAMIPLLKAVTNFPPLVDTYLTQAVLILGITLAVKTFNFTNIVGILRSGGDTRFTMFLDLGTLWLFGVPVTFLTGLVFHFPFYLVMICMVLEEWGKMIVGIVRLRSKKWIKSITHV